MRYHLAQAPAVSVFLFFFFFFYSVIPHSGVIQTGVFNLARQ